MSKRWAADISVMRKIEIDRGFIFTFDKISNSVRLVLLLPNPIWSVTIGGFEHLPPAPAGTASKVEQP